MKKFISKQKNCFWTLFSLILICETLLTINNRIFQTIGVVLTPFTVVFGILLIKNDNKKEEN